MSNVFSMELEGISNAWKMNVIIKRPVTRTTAMEAINSGVVSFCFSGLVGLSAAAIATGFLAAGRVVLAM
jgi:hypothetical protein